MKKILVCIVMLAAAALMLFADGGKAKPSKSGVSIDKVVYTYESDMLAAVQKVAAGTVDIVLNPVPFSVFTTIDKASREKLDVYSVPGGVWSILFNPVPNKAPYTWQPEDGEEFFNPFAVREIRFACNWLINRKKIVHDIFAGEGCPMLGHCIEGIAGSFPYTLISARLGITEEGDEQKALAMIADAMHKAAALPELKGKLALKKGKWFYKGKPVTIKSSMRVDAKDGRMRCSRYIHAQLEKAGFTVEGLEHDWRTENSIVHDSNPGDFQWSMCIEAWAAGSGRAHDEIMLTQTYAPAFGYMPGGDDSSFWNYTNTVIDEYAKKIFFMKHVSEREYRKTVATLASEGLADAVRVFVCFQNDFYVANKARFEKKLFYDVIEGFNTWTIRSAAVAKHTSGDYAGLRVLRVAVPGVLCTEPLSPFVMGSYDSACSTVIQSLSDQSFFSHPCTAAPVPLLSTVDIGTAQFRPALEPSDDDSADEQYTLTGTVNVPSDALIYDTRAKVWTPAGTGLSMAACVTGRLMPGYIWHNAEPVDNYDARYAIAFAREWASRDSEDDPYYDELIHGYMASRSTQAYVFNADGSLTKYANYYLARDTTETALCVGCVDVQYNSSASEIAVPWEIYEACSELIAHGSKSGTVYYAASECEGSAINLSETSCAADIKAKLKDFIAANHVPACLQGFVSVDYAMRRYKASIKFIDTYGHAYISNGPFMLETVDTRERSLVIAALKQYPYTSDYFPSLFRTSLTRIDSIQAPHGIKPGTDAVYHIVVSSYTYPAGDSLPLERGKVEMRLCFTDGREKTYAARCEKPGLFTCVIPASDLAQLKTSKGHALVVSSALADEEPASKVIRCVYSE